MGNLSSAIIEARKRHEAEIAERMKRRQMRQRAEVERLNASVVEPSALPTVKPVTPSPPVIDRPRRRAEPEPAVEPPVAPEATAEPSPSSASPTPQRAETAAEPAPLERLAGQPAAASVVAPSRPTTPAPPLIVEAPPAPPEPTRPAAVEPEPVVPIPPPIAAAVFSHEVETLPDGRFLRLRNDIIDRIKPYLTGNQFAVYMEIYRQTVGRGKSSAWFRTRDIQTACNLGSDNTVRDAYPVLEAKRLIRLDPNRRVGSPKGLHITVLSVERALERLERVPGTASARAVAAALPAAAEADEASDAPVPDDPILRAMVRRYGVSPSAAPHLLEFVREDDRVLLPYLFARLDRSVASGKVHNPGGLLRVWLESFESWRAELEADRARDEEAQRLARESASRDELMLEWFKLTEAAVVERVSALDSATLAAMKQRGRADLLARSPAVRTWTDAQWESQLDTYVKAEIRRELESFEAWLQRTGRG